VYVTSIHKINLVMRFWVDQLGWDAMAIAKLPRVFGASLSSAISSEERFANKECKFPCRNLLSCSLFDLIFRTDCYCS